MSHLSSNEWKYKRRSVKVDGYVIDACIFGKAQTLGNGRWVLKSNGNTECCERQLSNRSFKHILSKLEVNAVVFNYPGVVASTGLPNRKAMAKAYRSMLNYLEDQNNEVGAKEMIGYGHSIGGGVQGDALLSHKLKSNVKYCFVKSRTFSDFRTEVLHLTKSRLGITASRAKMLAFLTRLLGWNISSIQSLIKLQAPEIIMQTTLCRTYENYERGFNELSALEQPACDDGIIPAEAALSTELLSGKHIFAGKKYFIGIGAMLNFLLSDEANDHLVLKINEMLNDQQTVSVGTASK